MHLRVSLLALFLFSVLVISAEGQNDDDTTDTCVATSDTSVSCELTVLGFEFALDVDLDLCKEKLTLDGKIGEWTVMKETFDGNSEIPTSLEHFGVGIFVGTGMKSSGFKVHLNLRLDTCAFGHCKTLATIFDQDITVVKCKLLKILPYVAAAVGALILLAVFVCCRRRQRLRRAQELQVAVHSQALRVTSHGYIHPSPTSFPSQHSYGQAAPGHFPMYIQGAPGMLTYSDDEPLLNAAL
jgi:hypothetical protein